VPGFAIKLMYGEMSTIVTTGVRAEPDRLRKLGYRFRQPDLDKALAATA
jgi:NAD dependent epimerase/dehydratase family enzyme